MTTGKLSHLELLIEVLLLCKVVMGKDYDQGQLLDWVSSVSLSLSDQNFKAIINKTHLFLGESICENGQFCTSNLQSDLIRLYQHPDLSSLKEK